MDHDEREHSGRDRSDAKRESERASEHFKREVLFGEQQRDAGPPSKRLTLGPADASRPQAPAPERTSECPRESWRELEERQVRHLCKVSHVFENWREMNIRVRLGALMAVDRGIALIQKRPQLDCIGSYVGPPASRGVFWPKENRIELNRVVLRRRSARKAICSYLHEVRHVYQFDVIKRPSDHPEISTVGAMLWKAAAQLYPSMSDNPTFLQALAYDLNPLEIDARAFANRMWKRIMKEMGHVL